MKIRIATRASGLARAQAEYVARRLEAEAGVECEFVFMTTAGDRDLKSSLASMAAAPSGTTPSAGVGVFTREIQRAVLDGEADIAVHSLKDLPVAETEGSPEHPFRIGAFPVREDPRDAFVPAARLGSMRFEDLPEGAVIATSSPRRMALTRAYRPDITFTALRGNVETRLRKIDGGVADGTFLAVAGMKRLGIDRFFDPQPIGLFPPAAGQGIIAVEMAAARPVEALGRIDDATVRKTAEAERRLLRSLGGGCHNSVGVFLEPSWRLAAVREKEGILCKVDIRADNIEELIRRAEQDLL